MSERFVWTSERVAEALRPEDRIGPERRFTDVSTDTRKLRPGALFVALRGERFDGVEFVGAAAEAGAAGAVVDRRLVELPEDIELFVVDDALSALGQLATYRRRALAPLVVAITGTSGKTTTRELTVAALGERAYGSPGNFNNLVGVPLSMLGAPEAAAIWVLELASNQPGEIGRLARVVEPDHAVIVTVAEGHLEGLGDLEGVLEEKLLLLESLAAEGRAFVADEPEALARAARARHAGVVTVGLSSGADVRAESWRSMEAGVEWTWQGAEFRLPGFGSHLVRNGLFAAAVARLVGVPPATAAERLSGMRLPPMRNEVRRLDGMTLLVDCYNANPASFRAALEALQGLASGRRRVVVAGTMLELGAESAALHERIAAEMIRTGVDTVVAVGAFAEAFARLGEAEATRVIRADDLDEAYRRLVERLKGDEAVLIKASRGMRFERAVEMFERDFGGAGTPAAPEAEKGLG